MSTFGRGGRGRLRRSARDWVPAVGNTGDGREMRDGVLELNCVKMTGDTGDNL